MNEIKQEKVGEVAVTPAGQKKGFWKIRTVDLILCALFTALIAVGAFIKIPIPGVPFTLQVMFTTLAGLLLGSRMGAVSVAIYILLGLAGVPIFTGGGGIGYVLYPTFGYLIGFLIGTFVTGLIVERAEKITYLRLAVASAAGMAIVYFCGTVYFYLISNFYTNNPVGVWTVILQCFLVVLPGNVACCAGGVVLAKRLIPILRKERFS